MATCKDCFHWNACKKMLEAMWGHSVPSGYEGGADRCEDFISAADVVPRADFDRVARELERVEALYFAKDTQLENAKSEVAREIFEEIDKVYDECIDVNPFTNIGSLQVIKFEQMLAELKKKYTEGEK